MIGSVSGIAGRGDSSLIRPVPDAETLPFRNVKCLQRTSLKKTGSVKATLLIHDKPFVVTSNARIFLNQGENQQIH